MRRALLCAAMLALAAPAAAAPDTGLLKRSYVFAPTGEAMRYQLFVPKSYDGTKPLPLVIVLHGAGGDETRAFDDTGLPAIAEARNVMLLAVRGYSPFGGYGNFYPVVVTRSTAARGKDFYKRAAETNGTTAAPPAAPTAPRMDAGSAPGRPPAEPGDRYEQPASQLTDPIQSELSEQEVFTALAEVRKSYAIDPHRLYLMGNSAGGVGTLALAAKYPTVFAAVAPSGGMIAAWAYPWWRLSEAKLPVLFVHGDRDENGHYSGSKAMNDAARAQRVDTRFLLVPGGSHGRAWTMVLPQTFDFFAAHTRANPAAPPSAR